MPIPPGHEKLGRAGHADVESRHSRGDVAIPPPADRFIKFFERIRARHVRPLLARVQEGAHVARARRGRTWRARIRSKNLMKRSAGGGIATCAPSWRASSNRS